MFEAAGVVLLLEQLANEVIAAVAVTTSRIDLAMFFIMFLIDCLV